MAAYRVIQEALSNVVKHAAARRVHVTLDRDPDDNRARIVIRDDGKGFDMSARNEGGLGLVGMRERITAVGGSMGIDTQIGSGTKITLWLDLAQKLSG